MVYLNSRERTIYINSRYQELKKFITEIAKHAEFGFSEEFRIFLMENWEEHKKERRALDIQIGNL